MDVDIHLGEFPGTVLPEVGEDGSLDDPVDHHLPLQGDGLLGPFEGLHYGFGGLFLGPERLGEYVEDGTYIGAYRSLELHDLLVGELHLPVHVALEGSGIRHYDPGIIQHLVETFGLGLLLQCGCVLDDVRVGDHRTEAELVVEFPGCDGLDLGIDDGKQGGRLDGAPGRGGELAYAGHPVSFGDLKHCVGDWRPPYK